MVALIVSFSSNMTATTSPFVLSLSKRRSWFDRLTTNGTRNPHSPTTNGTRNPHSPTTNGIRNPYSLTTNGTKNSHGLIPSNGAKGRA